MRDIRTLEALLRRTKAEEDSYARFDKSLSTITVLGEITHKIASDFRQHLKILERQKKHSSIIVEINSPGGDIEAGFAIIDSIELCTKSVITRVAGIAYSMGGLILASGNVRESLPHSSIMVHQGSYRFSGTYHELDNEAEECKRIEKLCNDFLDRKTGKPEGYWEKRHEGKNLYLTPEQALNEGLIHSILKRKQQ